MLILFALAINWIYQVVCKPSELLFPVSGALYKTPRETWRQYGPAFTKYATRVISPQLLAAIAQVESSGNPLVRTYWRWSWTTQPFRIYRPASSAVGMYQITDSTFAAARRYCIHDHTVVQGGHCLYARLLPADAVELTSAYLDRNVAGTLGRYRIAAAPLAQQQRLAAVIHLCGVGGGEAYVLRGFRVLPGQRCGDHDLRAYLARVRAMMDEFQRLARLRA